MTNDKIEWVEQPPPDLRGRRAVRWEGEVAEMLANPGRWMVIRNASLSTSHGMRTGRLSAFKDGGFEVTSRNQKDGRCDLYVRYVGKNGDTDEDRQPRS